MNRQSVFGGCVEYPALFLLLVFGSLTFLSAMMVRHAYVELKYEKDFRSYHYNAIHQWFRVVVWSVIFAVFGVSSITGIAFIATF
jgi:hypothetical protein